MVLAVAAVLVAAAVGTGFALTYMSTTTSRDNEVSYDGITLDVLDSSHQPVDGYIPIAGPTVNTVENNLTHISGGFHLSCYLVVDCPSSVYVQSWMILGNSQSWAIIDSISLSITVPGDNNTTVTKKVTFMKAAADPAPAVGSVPSDPLQLSSGTYSFTVDVRYLEIDLALDGENQDFLELSGSYITFSAGLENPLPGTTNPWVTVTV